ncbi:hypothetical protein VCHA37P202_110118 [Vibrio chagasii]|nr:hypothetical protein VCHA37P202_110118 [Vibrio chagasii]CAH7111466.1 hypothetical protein VCHA49P380_10363 [Vibrio chagasii]
MWFEIPDTSFLGSGMTLTNRVNVRFITSKAKNYKRVTLDFTIHLVRHSLQ